MSKYRVLEVRRGRRGLLFPVRPDDGLKVGDVCNWVDVEEADLPDKMRGRLARFAPGDVPKKVRLYESRENVGDKWTCVFSGIKGTPGWFNYLAMSDHPFSPCGVGQHGQTQFQPPDRPRYSHLGRRAKWEDLPRDVQVCIWGWYADIWRIPVPADMVSPSGVY